eukprot:TRINITY_DN90278_c0_g1_i1.p1 TRINITY_DN90278_c0_g1~~TRINITY_DN90278_c0_g1_i1.p1  ORF type:complete len:467 (-),score=83.59 TRINITY_DN90278_c0_g1_i1:121-1521(-)
MPADRSRSPKGRADVLAGVIVRHVHLRDIRFHTSKDGSGSDARSKDPDYSCVYVELIADGVPAGVKGVGIAFSLGRGNEVLLQCARLLSRAVTDLALEECRHNFAAVWRRVTGAADGQLLWLGPEKGAVHQAGAALVNALWDLWAKIEQRPLWQLVATLPKATLLAALDLSDVTDVLQSSEVLDILTKNDTGKSERVKCVAEHGVPAYTTATGWAGYSDEKVRSLVLAAKAEGFTAFKMKVGLGSESDARRAKLLREVIGNEGRLMMDANSVWAADEAIGHMKALAIHKPLWIEEPLHPDDVLGHARVAKALTPLGIYTAGGEQTVNRVMMKQFLSSGGYTICQQDAVKLGGLNEWLVVAFMAKKFEVPMCCHAGGVGLCNMVAHLGAIDAALISGHEEEGVRMMEYIDHLSEHFEHPPKAVNGRYAAPIAPGWGLDMKPGALEQFEWPSGTYWADKPQHFEIAGW